MIQEKEKGMLQSLEQLQQHHQKQSFQDELRKFLTQCRITYKKEYVWN
jgi:hypothetical protein